MVSQTAKETVEQLKAEGLSPTFDDCVRLNALGLRVERGEASADLSVMPRVAFLGDYVLTEPTVAKWMYLDEARRLLGGRYLTTLFLTAYILNENAADLPKLGGLFTGRKLLKRVQKFTEDVLSGFSITEIEAAVDLALNGADPADGEDAEPTAKEKEERRKAKEAPEEARSYARALLAQAAGMGVESGVAKMMTIPALDRMITIALMFKGPGAVTGTNARATADFYRTADAIRERLLKEKEAKRNG